MRKQIHTSITGVGIPLVDLIGRSDTRADATAWMHADMARPLDLSAGPSYRFALIKIAADCVPWYGAFHHLVTDLFGGSVFSAVAVYLSRTTGSRDLVLGMPAAARTNTKLRGSTGLVVNHHRSDTAAGVFGQGTQARSGCSVALELQQRVNN